MDTKIKSYFLEIIERKKYAVLAMETNRDHVHILVEAKDRNDLSGIVRTIKAVSAKKILESTPRLCVGNVRHFWARRYGYRQIGESEIEDIGEYIRRQKVSKVTDTTGVSL